MPITYSTVKRDWPDSTVYVVGGGTSVRPEDVESLKGQRVIAVNSSYRLAHFADILFFADSRWWEREVKMPDQTLRTFKGTIYTVSGISKDVRGLPKLLRLRRMLPDKEGIALRPDTVAMQFTSVQSAINIAVHKGAKRIVVLGLDNQPDPDNPKNIHHHAEYPWPRRARTWDMKYDNLAHAVPVLKKLGVEVINTSPISTIDFWPTATVAETLEKP